MFPINLFEPERGRVVHLDVGIHVADVAVDDQVHISYVSIVTLTTRRKSKPPPRGATCFNSLNNF
jgi:hypothetical protein